MDMVLLTMLGSKEPEAVVVWTRTDYMVKLPW